MNRRWAFIEMMDVEKGKSFELLSDYAEAGYRPAQTTKDIDALKRLLADALMSLPNGAKITIKIEDEVLNPFDEC